MSKNLAVLDIQPKNELVVDVLPQNELVADVLPQNLLVDSLTEQFYTVVLPAKSPYGLLLALTQPVAGTVSSSKTS